jgi:CubicO group peptidase (beta-lactamase class C family)
MGGGLSPTRLTRLQDVLERYVDAGAAPGALAVVARHGAFHVAATGRLAFEGPGSETPMAADTICRLGSMTKPIVAACAMTLVEEGTLRLDSPVDPLLPELADMMVLADQDGPLDDVVPANRPITLRDLLTFRLGSGMVVAEPGTVPIADAIDALEDGQVPGGPDALPRDEWMRRLGAMPLANQPGERWLYDIGSNVAAVLIARATGKPVAEAIRERVCEPLGMKDTGFVVPQEDLGRLATAYQVDDITKALVVADAPDGCYSRPAIYDDGGGGMVSTADDYLAFAAALLAGGGKALSRPSVTLMTTNHLTPEQRVGSGFGPRYFDDFGWGFGVGVRDRRTNLGPSVGSYGWNGFYGTAWYNDPAEDLVVIFLQQRTNVPPSMPIYVDVWNAVYQAIED